MQCWAEREAELEGRVQQLQEEEQRKERERREEGESKMQQLSEKEIAIERYIITLGAHAQRGYSSCCLSVTLISRAMKVRNFERKMLRCRVMA